MLRESDLDTFIRLARCAEHRTVPMPNGSPDATLRAEGKSDANLHRAECGRLWRSLRIACAAGDAPEPYSDILEAIVWDLTTNDSYYIPLTHREEWIGAIRWGMSQQPSPFDRRKDRQSHVGAACRRLRERGFTVPIHAFGPHLDDNISTRIAGCIDSLIAKVGGVDTIHTLFRTMRKIGKLHDGMWLFGNLAGAVSPAIPYGWLLSIALRNIHKAPSTDRPEDSLKLAVEIATEFAAIMDCQRYNQYDGWFATEAPDFLFSLAESLIWRELFTLPQTPPSVLPTLRDAFSQIRWPDEAANLADEVDRLFAEFDLLVDRLCVDDLTAFPSSYARSAFPLLWQHARAAPGIPNAGYLDPFGADPRDHDRFVFLRSATVQRMYFLLLSRRLPAAK